MCFFIYIYKVVHVHTFNSSLLDNEVNWGNSGPHNITCNPNIFRKRTDHEVFWLGLTLIASLWLVSSFLTPLTATNRLKLIQSQIGRHRQTERKTKKKKYCIHQCRIIKHFKRFGLLMCLLTHRGSTWVFSFVVKALL